MSYNNFNGMKEDEINKAGTKANLEKLAGEIADMNYTDFTEGTDYASLAKRYSQQGQKAMDDTIGKVAARTGGMASSYATAAGNQAYNEHMGKLEDAARALYDSQRQEKIDNLGISKSLYDINYQEKRDGVADNRYVQGIQRENADIMQGRAQETIAMMLAAGMTMADIQKKDPDLVGNSGYEVGYWDSYEKQLNAPEVDTGSLTDYEKAVIQQYNNAVGEDGEGVVDPELQEAYDKIFGFTARRVASLKEQAMAATTQEAFEEIIVQIAELDKDAADEIYEEWLKKHPQPFVSWSGQATPAGSKHDEVIFG